VADKVGIGTTSPSGPLHAVGIDDGLSKIIFKEGTDTTTAGTPEIRIGIGTDDPQAQLHLTGNIRLPETAATSGVPDKGVIIFDTKPFIHTYGTDNTFIGLEAGNFTLATGSSTYSADQNTGIGTLALASLTDGTRFNRGDNTAVGYKALTASTEVEENVAIGSEALSANVEGGRITAIGSQAMQATISYGVGVGYHTTFQGAGFTVGSEAGAGVAIGYHASHSNLSRHGIAIGAHTLQYNTMTQNHTAIGALALSSVAASSSGASLAVGYAALGSTTTGVSNTAFGFEALKDSTTLGGGFGLGAYALMHNTAGSGNFAVGVEAALNTNNHQNFALGRSALRDSTTGRSNTAVGFEAGVSATGDYNLFIGSQAGSNEAGDYKLYIESSDSSTPLIYGEFDNDLLTVNGNLGVKTSTFGTGAEGVLAIANGTAPTSNSHNAVQLFAADVSSSSELKVRDEADNITTLSPHNFSLIPRGPSEQMAWSFYSERGTQAINVDMLKAVRLIERFSGEELVQSRNLKTLQSLLPQSEKRSSAIVLAREELEELRGQNQTLKQRLEAQGARIRLFQEVLADLREDL